MGPCPKGEAPPSKAPGPSWAQPPSPPAGHMSRQLRLVCDAAVLGVGVCPSLQTSTRDPYLSSGKHRLQVGRGSCQVEIPAFLHSASEWR